ncbi:hypothetical protein [Dokdonella sp.]|uniref:hypothetical protein n=1 Tax=Dokdonella sp. TaxID=2291710 RepID=UPI003BB0A972
MRAMTLLFLCILTCCLPKLARAELMIGGYPPGASSEHPIRQFSATAQGTAPAIRQIGGPTTTLNGPANASYEPVENLIYVSDYWGQAIKVFPAFASGDPAPLRVLNPPLLGQPRASVPMAALDELIVIASNCCIYTFPLHASGTSVNRIRSINWGGGSSSTQLNNPSSLIWLPGTDEVAVVDYDFNAPYAAKVVFHARTSDGSPAPTRVLKSIHTENAAAIAHDPGQHKLYLLTYTTPDNFVFEAQVRVFADTASGTDAPLYIIAGPATQLGYDNPQYPTGIGIDQPLQRLMVAIGANGDPDNNRVVSFALGASGDATPVQVLSGASLSPGTIGAPFAVPVDILFKNGFEN